MSLKQAKKDNKLSPKYYGPYKVLQKIGAMAYKLELPTTSWLHPVFHVSCLKKVIGDTLLVQIILLEIDEEGKIILEPEAITKQELNSYEIDQIWSILSSGRTYPLKIPHGRMRILYSSIQNYSNIEDQTFLKERGMLGPYNTKDYPITIVLISLINIFVPLLSPYCYYCAP